MDGTQTVPHSRQNGMVYIAYRKRGKNVPAQPTAVNVLSELSAHSSLFFASVTFCYVVTCLGIL